MSVSTTAQMIRHLNSPGPLIYQSRGMYTSLGPTHHGDAVGRRHVVRFDTKNDDFPIKNNDFMLTK